MSLAGETADPDARSSTPVKPAHRLAPQKKTTITIMENLQDMGGGVCRFAMLRSLELIWMIVVQVRFATKLAKQSLAG